MYFYYCLSIKIYSIRCEFNYMLSNISCYVILPCQALRYPYFQVGQVLGQRPQTPDLRNTQVKTAKPNEIKSELQSASEPVLHSQTKDKGRNSHQTLQLISLPQGPIRADHEAEPLSLNTKKVKDIKAKCSRIPRNQNICW